MKSNNFIFLLLLLFSCKSNLYSTKGVTDFNLTYLDEIKKVKLNPEDTLFCFAVYTNYNGSFFLRKNSNINYSDTVSFYEIESFFETNRSYNRREVYILPKHNISNKVFYIDLINEYSHKIYFDSLFECYQIPNTDTFLCGDVTHHCWFNIKILTFEKVYEWTYKTTSYPRVIDIINSRFKSKIIETNDLLVGNFFGPSPIISNKFKGVSKKDKKKKSR
jgi:hypothetical protein